VDQVQKGQIAHIDQNNQNFSRDNLAFMCLDHHDEFDGKTKQSKGLTAAEVKTYRDELYKEMEHRFSSIQRPPELSLVLREIKKVSRTNDFTTGFFELHNAEGAGVARNPVVAFRLADGIDGNYFGQQQTRDYFEPDGRVGNVEPPCNGNLILPGDAVDFHALGISEITYPAGSVVRFQFRLIAEGLSPVFGEVEATQHDGAT
jgi:hypothetical protein